MIEDKYSFQNPYIFDKTNLLQIALTFGNKIESKTFENGFTFKSSNDDFIIFMTEYTVYDILNKYGIFLSYDEDCNVQLLTFDISNLDSVMDNLHNSNELDLNLFLDYSEENKYKIFLCCIEYLYNEYNSIVEYIKKLSDTEAKNIEINSNDITRSIDNQLADLDCEPDWFFDGVGYTYYMYNNINNVYALCKKTSSSTDVIFIMQNEYDKLLKEACSTVFNNYWNMCSNEDYQKNSLYCTEISMMTNRLNSISLMLALNGFDIDGKQLSFFKKLKMKRLKNKLEVKLQIK